LGLLIIFLAWSGMSCSDDNIDGDAAADADTSPEADVGGDADSGDDADTDGDSHPERVFSFAILTDIHIGEGYDDFDTPGYDDTRAGSFDDDHVVANVRTAITKINDNIEDYELAFVMVLGDLTGSGERSELLLGRELLGELDLPFFPLIGNHDMWPYTTTEEAPGPIGDQYFDEVWADHLVAVGVGFDGFERAPGPVTNPDTGVESTFINYAFEHSGYHFIALDLGTRDPAPDDLLGVNGEADLHDFDGGTWRWFTTYLESREWRGEGEILVFSHHLPNVSLPTFDMLPEEEAVIGDFIRTGGYADTLRAFFAGHHHMSYEYEAFFGQSVIVTEAAKETTGVRIVQIFDDGTMDWSLIL
jgi:3',5'-cyclic AMP phosphodiesterase CpdA